MAKNLDINNDVTIIENDLTNNNASVMPLSNNSASDSANTFSAQANDTVTIADPSPVIILFGAGESGKTMTLIRLSKFLIQHGYKVSPERTFRNARDTHYQNMCNNFTSIVNSTKAPGRNQVIDFMLVKVMDKWGRPICQLLEAPGEHYFDPAYPNRSFPAYINAISQSNNRRTWVFIVEKDWLNQSDRNNFASKITQLQQAYVKTPGDKVIFTCHKADLHPQYMDGGRYNVPLFFNDIKNQYPNIFSKYVNNNPISKLWRKYSFDFVVFSAGLFSDDGEGGQNYVPSNPSNPALLWKSILKTVKGGW
jgi:hypothetical protein